jgi:hypothetical protein
VTEFFKGESYVNKPKVITKYAKWAVRGNVPALFSAPTPVECMVPKGTDGYVVRISTLSKYVSLAFINHGF